MNPLERLQNEYLKTLWLIRFEKIKRTEEQSAWKYQEMLDHNLMEFGRSEVTDLLAELVKEERMHERLADELLRICRAAHPEFEMPSY